MNNAYTELKSEHKFLQVKSIVSIVIIMIIGLLIFRRQWLIIDRYNHSVVMRTTAYTTHPSECNTKYKGYCFTGVKPVVGRTVAVDPDVIPLGSHITVMQGIMIQGKRYFEFVVEDTGNLVRGEMIDIYFGNESQHKYAVNYGVKNLLVYREEK